MPNRKGVMLAIGDSTTEAGMQDNTYYVTNLFPKLVHNAIKTNYGNCLYVNKGTNGLNTSGLVNNKLFWNKIKPDLIICSIGANDAINTGSGEAVALTQTKANLQTIYNEFLSMNPYAHVIFCIPWYGLCDGTQTPFDYMPPRPLIADYRTAIIEFCQGANTQNNVIDYVDFTSAWEDTTEAYSTNTWDGIHPNDVGTAKLFDIIWEHVQGKSWLNLL